MKFSLKKDICDAKTFYFAVITILLCVICAISALIYLDNERTIANKISKECLVRLDRCTTKIDQMSDNLMKVTCRVLNQSGDIRKFPRATGSLRVLQRAETVFLKKVVDILDKHNIPYWLADGTLLGCMRHGGFIPWDDDIDIGVMREDYDKLPGIFEEEFKDDKDFYYVNGFFGKVTSRSMWMVIDIFPADIYPKYLPDNGARVDLKNKILEYKKGFGEDRKFVDSMWTVKMTNFGKEISDQEIRDLRENLLDVEPTEKKHLLLCPEVYHQWVFDYDWIFPLKTATFEGLTFKIPNKPEMYLFEEYRDWMQYPETLGGHDDIKKFDGQNYEHMLEFIRTYEEASGTKLD